MKILCFHVEKRNPCKTIGNLLITMEEIIIILYFVYEPHQPIFG